MAVWFAILQNTREGIKALEDETFEKVLLKEAQGLNDADMVKFEKIIKSAIKRFKQRTIKY